MNKNESRYQSTAILFDEALINLLEHKDIDYITIKEICDKAGVNGSTLKKIKIYSKWHFLIQMECKQVKKWFY